MHARTQSLLVVALAMVGLVTLLMLLDRTASSATANPTLSIISAAALDQTIAVDDDANEVEEEDEEEGFVDEEDSEDGDEEEKVFDEAREHLEMERTHLETQFAQFELAHRIAETARDEVTTAAFAVMHIEEMFEEPEELIGFLVDCRNETENDAIKRVISVKLAHIYAESDQPEKVRETMKKLIIGK